jgi:hypothetical protein
MRKLSILLIIASLSFTASCSRDAQVASQQLSAASDNFEIDRRIIFYNGITGQYMLTITGRCAIEPERQKLAVTCKTSPAAYKKHYLGLSDNVTWFAEQLESATVSVYRYKVVFKPSVIIPDIDVKL